MERLLKRYAERESATPAIDSRGNLMMDHGNKFIDISWEEFLKKLSKEGRSIVVASEKSSAMA